MVELPDHYAVLGLAHTAGRSEVRAAYRRLAMQHHPDVNPVEEDDEAATEFMARLNEAYATLYDPARRKAYDLACLPRRRPPPPRPQHTVPPDGDVDHRPADPVSPRATNRRGRVPPNTVFEPSWLERYWAAEEHLREQLSPLTSLLAIMLPVFAVAVLLVVGFAIYLLLSQDPQSVLLAGYLRRLIGGPESLVLFGLLVLLTVAMWVVWRATSPRR